MSESVGVLTQLSRCPVFGELLILAEPEAGVQAC